jgi:RimJ/RimL family protein N-acetyltransferase
MQQFANNNGLQGAIFKQNILVSVGGNDSQLNKIEVRCAVKNFRRPAIAECLGFIFNSLLHQNEPIKGEYFDKKLFSILHSIYFLINR